MAFPGGNVEPGESPETALVREIREELDANITITEFLTTVVYDYPEFHLSMDCFMAELKDGSELKLKEHEAARWLPRNRLDAFDWLSVNRIIFGSIKRTDEMQQFKSLI